MTGVRRGLEAVALDNNDYLVDTLEELRKHARITLRQARKYRRKAGTHWCEDSKWFINRASEFENQARKDLEQIQRILANPNLNK